MSQTRDARAALVFQLNVTGISGQGVVLDAKHVTGVAAGDVITYDVVAEVSGTNSALMQGFQSAKLTIFSGSTGTIQLNLTQSLLAPFNSNASWPGTPSNLGGDTDTDIGPANPNNTSAGVIIYRSAQMEFGGIGNGAQFRIGTGTMSVTDASGSPSLVQLFLPATTAADKNPLWAEDSTGVAGPTFGFKQRVDSGPNQGFASVGSPVIVSVPEPAALGLLALGAVTLLGGRRTNRS